jgi:DNA modification methylase
MTVRIINADVFEGLRRLPDQSVHCVVTSPPYWNLRDYGIPPSVWGGDSACAHEWEQPLTRRLRGKVGDKSTIDGDQSRSGTRLEISHNGCFCQCGAWRGCFGSEPTPDMYIEHAVAVFREIRRVLRSDGTVWLNVGNGVKGKDLIGIPWMMAFALRADGWHLRSEIIWHKPNGMPESVTDRPTRSHDQVFLLTKRPRYYYDQQGVREPCVSDGGSSFGAVDDAKAAKTAGA